MPTPLLLPARVVGRLWAGLLLLLRRQGAAQVAHVLADMVAIEQRGLGHENPVDIVAD